MHNEAHPVLVTRIYGNSWQKAHKKIFFSPFRNIAEKKKI